MDKRWLIKVTVNMKYNQSVETGSFLYNIVHLKINPFQRAFILKDLIRLGLLRLSM